MKILMMTNTYKPHVGGVARSVEFFVDEYRKLGHEVIVVAPEFQGIPDEEIGVIRIPAIQNFNGSDFSVSLPIPGFLHTALEELQPDIVHSHHPFLLGNAALRISELYNVPLVFTHHTMYEQYTHYAPTDSESMKKFAIHLSVGYCNLCRRVVAPSESVRKLLIERGVETKIISVPTGVYIKEYESGDPNYWRAHFNINADEQIIGHIGRLAPEKNLPFLSHTVAEYLSSAKGHFMVVGDGPSRDEIEREFAKHGLSDRLHFTGRLGGQQLIDAYHAMDVFAFASKSETQGMVLIEAMAAGTPVIALDAPGAREVVQNRKNGRLVMNQDQEEYVKALRGLLLDIDLDGEPIIEAARMTAQEHSMRRCAERMIEVYREAFYEEAVESESDDNLWSQTMDRIKAEWNLLTNVAEAASQALSDDEAVKELE